MQRIQPAAQRNTMNEMPPTGDNSPSNVNNFPVAAVASVSAVTLTGFNTQSGTRATTATLVPARYR